MVAVYLLCVLITQRVKDLHIKFCSSRESLRSFLLHVKRILMGVAVILREIVRGLEHFDS